MSTGQLDVKVGADTSQLQAGFVQAAAVSEAQMKRIARSVLSANQETARIGSTAQKAANDTRAAYDTISTGADKVAHAHSGVNRELIVLAHEMSQGNYSRFGGSMLVLAERTNALQFAMTGAGLATLGLGGAVLGALVLIAKGAIDADRFGKALQLTGNYAAVTQAQLDALAASQSKLTGQSVGTNRSSLEASAGSGQFGPQAFAQVARAMTEYRRLSNDDAADALKIFEGMKNGVAAWAETENRSFHFATLAQIEHIKKLEDMGQADRAAAEAAGLLADTLTGRAAPALSVWEREWERVWGWITKTTDAIGGIGRPVDELGATLGRLDAQMAQLQALQGRSGKPQAFSDAIGVLQDQRRALARQQSDQAAQRARTAEIAATQQAGIEAKKYTDQVLQSGKALSARNKELAEFDVAVKKQAAAGTPLSDADVKAGHAIIEKKFAPTDVRKQADEYTNLIATVKAFTDTTAQEVGGLSKLTEGQRFVVQIQEALTKSGKALSDQQRQRIALNAQIAARARDSADADLHASEELKKSLDDGAQKELEDARARFDRVEEFTRGVMEQIAVINEQKDAIGKSADELAKMQALQKLNDSAGKAIHAGGDASQIMDAAAALRGQLVPALDAAKAANDAYNASFSNGVHDAMRDYVATAQNQAAQGAKFFNDAVGGMTDALVQFAQTGKLSFKGLIDTMISDLLRMQVQKGFTALFGSGSGLGGLFGALFGGGGSGSAAGTGGDYSTAGLAAAFGYANGLDYVPYDGFPAILHAGEQVLTKQDATANRSGSGGHSFVFNQSYNIGEGVSRADVTAAVQQGQAQTELRMRRLLKNGSVVSA